MELHKKSEQLKNETHNVKKAAKKKTAKKNSIVAKEFKLF
ncbi:hypothetical protein SME17J_26130 [Serratia marcescens]|nr:hypothetical protein SME17J_26130 [Serratia marcescens]